MELRHLRYFVAVADECHFGRAAAQLHMAQPPLSHQIRQLENDLGVQLFVRSTRKVALTPAGTHYLDRARAILAEVDAAGRDVASIAAGRLGRLAIGLTGSATYQWLPQLAWALRAELPLVDLDLKGEMLTPSQVDALLAGTLDLGLLRPPVRNAELEIQILRHEPLIAVIPQTHPLAAKEPICLFDLRDEPFICYPSRNKSVVYDAVFDACARAGFTPSEVVEVAETSTLVSFVAAGLGVALVPESVRHLRITGAEYCSLANGPAEVALAVAVGRNSSSPLVCRALDCIKQVVARKR